MAKGERASTNYKRSFPLMTRGRNLTFYEENGDIYIKWVKPVESQSYIVKVTFDYFNQKYTLLQHITGDCKDLGMERMNNAIKYLCQSGAFIKGEKT